MRWAEEVEFPKPNATITPKMRANGKGKRQVRENASRSGVRKCSKAAIDVRGVEVEAQVQVQTPGGQDGDPFLDC